ncbi:hypothetical protein PaG_06501 [Moesziomyces aphidis]|uniref:RING-type domain-containing protein n=1 Tax=Moesziomyces aphidis TaxID=84754 RepID=W3VDG1_MOEAP|nr:hypothetical protein PaG_06501 [Moesziomyces aphidis]
MSEPSEPGPSSGSQPRSHAAAIARRRSSGNRTARPRPSRARATSSISQRSDASNISSGIQKLSWTTGDSFDYVDDDARISAFLHCPICLGPFLEPFVSSCCSHTFCKHCIHTALSEDASARTDADDDATAPRPKRCPTCRASADFSHFQPTALLIKNMVDTLRVRCPNKDKGCDHQCERHLLRGHVASECAYEYVDQNLTEGRRCGCSAKVMRKDWASHGLTCPKRPVTCATCDSELCFDELQDHLSTCSPEPAECEFCGLTTIKSRLALHVVDECTEAPVECPHAAFGCSWTGPRRRLRRASNPLSKQIDHAHLEDDCRFEPLKPFFGVFTHHVEQLRDENHALKSRLDELEARQYTQARRVDDCVHSLGTWYRSAGEMRAADLEQRARGSQVGVDGEWDEFPLDAQNWERSLSQQSFSRQTRAHSASAVASMDLEMWARRQYAEALTPDPVATARPSTGSQRATPGESSGSRYLTPAAARSAPTSSVLARRPGLVPSPSTSRERAPQLGDASAAARRSGSSIMLAALEAGSLGAVSPGSYGFPAAAMEAERELDRSSLDSAIASLTASVAGLSSGLNSLDKRTEEGHIAAVKAGFDAGRVQEEVASLRHGLHAVRMQIHQILMHQQRHALFSPPVSNLPSAASGSNAVLHEQAPPHNPANLPMLTPPLLRRWAGLDQTKL